MVDELGRIEQLLRNAIIVVSTEQVRGGASPRLGMLRHARRWAWTAALELADLLAPYGHGHGAAAGSRRRPLAAVAASGASGSDGDVELAAAMLATLARRAPPRRAGPGRVVVLARRFVLRADRSRGLEVFDQVAPTGCRLRIVVAPMAWPIITITVEPDVDGGRVHPVFAPLGVPT